MSTILRIIPTMILEVRDVDVQVAYRPSLDSLRSLVEPHLEGMGLEHVTVLYEGERRDMFVGEDSALRCPRNVRATEIYWNAARAAIAAGMSPDNYPEPWPPICGPAVLFPHRQVWF